MYCLLSNKYISINKITEILKEMERKNWMNGSSRNTGLMWLNGANCSPRQTSSIFPYTQELQATELAVPLSKYQRPLDKSQPPS